MKIAALVARILLGLVFTVFGFNHLVPFIPMGPMPTGPAGQFMGAMMTTHYLFIVGIFEVAPGILLLINRYVPLGLTLLGPVLFNILLVDILMAPKALPIGILCTILWFVVFVRERAAFAGIFQQRTQS